MCQHPSCSPSERHGRHLPKSVTRRDILRYSLAGMGIAALGPLGNGAIPTALGAPGGQSRLVVINLYGGNDGLNTVVPVGLQPYFDRRPTLALDPAACLSLDSGPEPTTAYRLHPVMTNVRSLWTEGAVAIVNKVGYPNANLSHFTSQDIYSLGVRNDFAPLGLDPSGWVARYADLYAPTPMGAVGVGVGRPLDFVGGQTTSFLVESLANFRFLTDGRYPNNHAYRIEKIKEMLAGFSGAGLSSDVKDALDQGHTLADQVQTALANYDSGGVTYPTNAPGAYLRDVAVLIEGGFETRLFYTGEGGFDTHGAQGAATGQHATLLQRLDQAIGGFAQDMKNRGVWDDLAIVVLSEFGRRSYQNDSDGTDHGHGNCFLVIGGAVNGGMYGADLTEADLNAEWPPYDVDFRDVHKELIQDVLGDDPAPIFPEAQEKNVVLGIA
jgi:uncharacterized protein (DUF1501 family)